MVVAVQGAVSEAGWVSPLGPAGPTPDGAPLVLSVDCRTSRGRRGRRHKVTIEPDWSLTTPHDLEAERIAQAFGGYLTCVDLTDMVVPSIRGMVQLLARRQLPALAQVRPGRWRVLDQAAGCACVSFDYERLVHAVEHEREPAHWARLAPAAPEQLLARLAETVIQAGGWFRQPPSVDAVRPLVREPVGPADLWRAGVPPEFVQEVYEAVSLQGEPLPTRLYQAAAFARPSYAWLADLLAVSRNADVVTGVAWTNTDLDRTEPGARMQWLELGLPRADVEDLMRAGCSVSEAADVAAGSNRSIKRAAIQLAAWRRAGCQLRPMDLLALDRAGASEWFAPSAAAIDWLEARTRLLDPRPTRNQVGMALAVAGTTKEALQLLTAGVRAPLIPVAAFDRPSAPTTDRRTKEGTP